MIPVAVIRSAVQAVEPTAWIWEPDDGEIVVSVGNDMGRIGIQPGSGTAPFFLRCDSLWTPHHFAVLRAVLDCLDAQEET